MFSVKQTVLLSCLIVTSFASHSSSSISTFSTQSYRKINFPLKVWNLFSSSKTEEVTIAADGLRSGIIECGVACHTNSDCGGFSYDQTSRACSMKLVKTQNVYFRLYVVTHSVFVSTKPVDSLRDGGFCGSLCQTRKVFSLLRTWHV